MIRMSPRFLTRALLLVGAMALAAAAHGPVREDGARSGDASGLGVAAKALEAAAGPQAFGEICGSCVDWERLLPRP